MFTLTQHKEIVLDWGGIHQYVRVALTFRGTLKEHVPTPVRADLVNPKCKGSVCSAQRKGKRENVRAIEAFRGNDI